MKNANKYAEGDEVVFNYAGSGMVDTIIPQGRGRICGLGLNGIMPMWIVKVDTAKNMGDYSYSCILVPESLISPI